MPIEFLVFQLHAFLGFRLFSHMHGMQDKNCYSVMYVSYFSISQQKLLGALKVFLQCNCSVLSRSVLSVTMKGERPKSQPSWQLTDISKKSDCSKPATSCLLPATQELLQPSTTFIKTRLFSWSLDLFTIPHCLLVPNCNFSARLPKTHFVGIIASSFALVKSTKPIIVFATF